jgi:uncharacterized protein YhfF
MEPREQREHFARPGGSVPSVPPVPFVPSQTDPVAAAADAFWQAYLETLPSGLRQRSYFEAFQFGAGRAMADQEAQLVLDGIKTATSDLIWHMEWNQKPRWKVGDEHIVLDGGWRPVCVIRTTELEKKRFCDVDAAFAYHYGEGDRTLAWWREHVFAWYASQCREMGVEPGQEMPLLCERFEVVYAPGRVAAI